MSSADHKLYVITNAGDHVARLRYTRQLPRHSFDVLYGTPKLQDGLMEIEAHSTVVVAREHSY